MTLSHRSCGSEKVSVDMKSINNLSTKKYLKKTVIKAFDAQKLYTYYICILTPHPNQTSPKTCTITIIGKGHGKIGLTCLRNSNNIE